MKDDLEGKQRGRRKQTQQQLVTRRKTSSAPLKRKIKGRGGTQLESTTSLASSSIEAEKETIGCNGEVLSCQWHKENVDHS